MQIKTILFSIIYGAFFSIVVGLNYKFIVGGKIFSFILTFMLVFVLTLLYFLGLKYINFGVFHFYEILSIIIGFILENLFCSMVEKKFKK